MKLFVFAVCYIFTITMSAPYNKIKNLAIKHKALALWVFNASDPSIFSYKQGKYRFQSLVNGFELLRGGVDSLTTGEEKKNGLRIPYIDFSKTDNVDRGAILYTNDPGLDLSGSFTLIVVFKRHNELGFDNGGFLAGKWEECDRSRSYGLFGNLTHFGRERSIVAHISNTGYASPPTCEWAEEAALSPEIENYDDLDLWHTAAMVWNSSKSGENSKERETACNPSANYTCTDNRSGTCSSLQSFIDGKTNDDDIKYFKYKNVYQGSDLFIDHNVAFTNKMRKALFTVGGTAAQHWQQPDHRDNDNRGDGKSKMVANFTILGYPFKENIREKTSDDWKDDFISKVGDMFVRNRFRGLISSVFVFKKALNKAELQEFNVNKLYNDPVENISQIRKAIPQKKINKKINRQIKPKK